MIRVEDILDDFLILEDKDKWILENRVCLKGNFGISIIPFIEIFMEGKDSFKVNDNKICLKFCETINKHTCLLTKLEKVYMIVDIHQIEVVSSFIFLYIMFGKYYVLYKIVKNKSKIFEYRLQEMILELKTEYFFLNGDILEAFISASNLKNYENIDLDRNTADPKLYYIANQSFSDIIMLCHSIYIYHEMAHACFKLEPESDDVRYYRKQVIDFLTAKKDIKEGLLVDHLRYISESVIEEIACDVWSVYNILEKNKNKNEVDFRELVGTLAESYAISIMSLHCIVDTDKELKYNVRANQKYGITIARCHITALIVEKLISEKYEDKALADIFISNFQKTFGLISNFYELFDFYWSEFEIVAKNKVQFMSTEWNKYYDGVIDILSDFFSEDKL